MKKILISSLLLLSVLTIKGQDNRVSVLKDLEKNQDAAKEIKHTATLKTSSRLFGDMNDLTSVITIVPSGSVVDVIGSDSTYLKIIFEDTTGYIFKRHASVEISKIAVETAQKQAEENSEGQNEINQNQVSRFSYLENKYGTNMAARLAAGKIWKGMNSDMVKDSWGQPQKINRVISGNIIKEEWIYKNTWLYIENGMLSEWGPITR